ncbi:MAG: ABC transporter ATP-binding protein [Atopostipes suicloacalis]|nr:ABC transporter ATP-binding protein [Atopostipes suicloacalis]
MIEYKNVSKIYNGEVLAVDNVNLKINENEFVCFIGTSGSGKTTALRLINQMEEINEGDIFIDGKNIQEVDPIELRRGTGYVIQQTGLFPHMTIYENIVTVPKLLEWSEKEMRETAEQLMERVDLPIDLLDRYPSELSGGQQQRIGVIRALAANPDIVLMDEPFGALDPITRDALHELVIELQKEYNSTFVFVTHDMDEALKLGDRIAIWHEGKVMQYDTPDNILAQPANEHVRDFLGEDRMFNALRENIQVKDIMKSKAVSIKTDQTVSKALTLMQKKKVDTLFIVNDKNQLQGLVTIEDIAEEEDIEKNVTDIMLTSVRPLKEDSLIQNQMRKALKRKQSAIPVINNKKELTGVLTKSTLVNLVYDIIWDQSTAQEEILEKNSIEGMDD